MRGGESGAQFSLNVVKRDGTSTVVNADEVTRKDVEAFLDGSRKREFEENTYFPVRQNIPKTILLSIKDAANDAGIFIADAPLLMQAKATAS